MQPDYIFYIGIILSTIATLYILIYLVVFFYRKKALNKQYSIEYGIGENNYGRRKEKNNC